MSKPKRNDPCPCGSGKKYKKCCGKAQSQTIAASVLQSGSSTMVSKVSSIVSKIATGHPSTTTDSLKDHSITSGKVDASSN